MFQPTKKWDLKVCFKAEVDQIISYKTPRIYRKHNFVILLINRELYKGKNNNSMKLMPLRRQMKWQYLSYNPETKLLGQRQDGGGIKREGYLRLLMLQIWVRSACRFAAVPGSWKTWIKIISGGSINLSHRFQADKYQPNVSLQSNITKAT